MNCDPNSLISSASCYRCIPAGKQGAVLIYLLCQWSNNTACQISWTPETAIAQWTDGSGNHSGNLSVFLSTADIATVSLLNLDGTGITNIDGLNCLPSLQEAQLGANNFTSLDITGCTSLVILESGNSSLETITGLGTATSLAQLGISFCNILGSLDLSVAPSLIFVAVTSNPNLTSVNLTGLVNLLSFDCNTCPNLTALTLTGCTALTSLTCNDCGSLTTFTDITDCTALVTLACNACALTGTLSLSGLLNLVTLNCFDNTSLAGLTLTGCVALVTCDCNNCALTVITDVDDCTQLDYLHCQINQLTTLDVQNSTLITTLDCSDNSLTALNVTGLNIMIDCDIHNNPGLGSVTGLSTCVSIQGLFCGNCGLTELDMSTITGIVNLQCDTNLIGSTGILNLTGCGALNDLNCGGNSLTSLDLTDCVALIQLSCGFNSLVDLRIGPSINYTSVDAPVNALPASAVAPVEGVDEVLVNLQTNCLGNAGIVDLSGGTNGTPDAGPPDGAAAVIALTGAGWTVNTN